MFVSFCLIVKYHWVPNQLSLNCGVVPGSGLAPNGSQTISFNYDDVTLLMQMCHNNNSNNINTTNNSKANPYSLA